MTRISDTHRLGFHALSQQTLKGDTHPIEARRGIKYWQKQVSGTLEIRNGEFSEELLALQSGLRLDMNLFVVGNAARERFFKIVGLEVNPVIEN